MPDHAAQRALAARVLPLLDVTSLGEQDSPGKIEALCASTRTPHGFPAAVCVYPEHVTTARRCLAGTSPKVATVVNFPDGGDDPRRVERETLRALAAGADEIDLVLPYRALLRGDAPAAARVVAACRAVCGGGVIVKLIIEAGELRDAAAIRAACAIGIDASVDFLKTSTGKVPVNATAAAVAVMLDVIAGSGKRCGLKVAGGVRTLADAAAYLRLAEARFGAGWIGPARFRIGASGLLTELVEVLSRAH